MKKAAESYREYYAWEEEKNIQMINGEEDDDYGKQVAAHNELEAQRVLAINELKAVHKNISPLSGNAYKYGAPSILNMITSLEQDVPTWLDLRLKIAEADRAGNEELVKELNKQAKEAYDKVQWNKDLRDSFLISVE